MNLEDLRSVQRTERQKDSLQHLRDSFYEDVAEYVEGLKAERERAAAAADDPFASSDVRQLTDEIETAEDVVEAIYERRVGKVVKLASFAAAEMHVEEEGMTTQEHALFEDLVDRIKENKTTVLDILSGEAEAPAPATDAAEPEPQSASQPEQAPPGANSEPAPSKDPSTDQSPEPKPDPDDVLASAMGGGPETDDSDDSDATSTSEAPTERTASDETADGAASERTPVDPEPAPPGASDTADQASEDGPVLGNDVGTETSAESPGGDQPAAPTPGVGGATTGAASREGRNTGSAVGEEPAGAGDAGTVTDDVDRTTVRVTQDVGEILCIDDREYDLASEDVVTLPTVNAEPLVQRDAAERLD